MGALKQSVIDTPLEDQTDPREPSTYPGEESDKPTDAELAVGFAMFDLQKAIKVLQEHKPYSEYAEIDKAQADLAQLIADMDVPF